MIASPKIETKNMLEKLPDDSTFEDIQYHLYVIEKIQKGREQIQNGDYLTSEQARQKVDKWLLK